MNFIDEKRILKNHIFILCLTNIKKKSLTDITIFIVPITLLPKWISKI